jgi:hypothetical protein
MININIKDAGGEWHLDAIATEISPVVSIVDFGSLRQGQILDVEIRVALVGDTVLRLPARISRIVYIPVIETPESILPAFPTQGELYAI